MVKKTFGIVSSFDVLCGNATYSEAIAKGLESVYDVARIDVPTGLQRNFNSHLVDRIASSVKQCDMVNIQMEFGLFGPTPGCALRVLHKIIKNARAFSVTMHRIDPAPEALLRQLYRKVKAGRIKELVRVFISWLVQRKLHKSYRNLIKLTCKYGGQFIVHTHREHARITKICKEAKVSVYPIVWPELSVNSLNLKRFFTNDYPVVGLFGFVSPYKNYGLVFDALKDFPVNILLVGGTHPQIPTYGKASKTYGKVSQESYIRTITNQIFSSKYTGRAHIVCSPSDAELLNYIKSVDVVCVPYEETGQSGSGIASLAIQYGRKVVFSDTHCTSELTHFLNRKPVVFDADSPFGCLCAIRDIFREDIKINFNGYDFPGMLQIYKAASIRQD